MTSDELLNIRGMALKSAILDPISDGLSKLTMKWVNKLLSSNSKKLELCKEQKAQNDRIRQVYNACKNVQEIGPEAKAKMVDYILNGTVEE